MVIRGGEGETVLIAITVGFGDVLFRHGGFLLRPNQTGKFAIGGYLNAF
jgi:hypothetical protein